MGGWVGLPVVVESVCESHKNDGALWGSCGSSCTASCSTSFPGISCDPPSCAVPCVSCRKVSPSSVVSCQTLCVNERTVDATDPGDAVALVAIFGLVWLLGSVWVGGWLAARVSGHELGVGFAQSFRVLIGLWSHMSNPAAAWPSPASERLP